MFWLCSEEYAKSKLKLIVCSNIGLICTDGDDDDTLETTTMADNDDDVFGDEVLTISSKEIIPDHETLEQGWGQRVNSLW